MGLCGGCRGHGGVRGCQGQWLGAGGPTAARPAVGVPAAPDGEQVTGESHRGEPGQGLRPKLEMFIFNGKILAISISFFLSLTSYL